MTRGIDRGTTEASAFPQGWVVLAATAVVFLWASAFVAVKIALEDLSPGPLALTRYAVATLFFAVVVILRWKPMPRGWDWARLALSGAIGISLYNIALNSGQQTVTAGIASLLVNTVPIFTSLLAVAFLREPISRFGWAGMALSFCGVAIIGLHKAGWSGFEQGTLAILCAAFSQALYFILIKPLLNRYHPIEVTAYVVWFGTLFLLPFSTEALEALQTCQPQTLLAVIYLGLGPAAVAYLAWSFVLSEVPAAKASNVLFLVPVVALGLGWAVLHEVPSGVALLGGTLAIGGVVLSRRDPLPRLPSPTCPSPPTKKCAGT